MNAYFILGFPLFSIALCNALLGVLVLKNNPQNSNLNRAVSVVGFSAALYAFFAGMVYVCAGLKLDYSNYYKACHLGWFALPAFYQITYYIKDDKSRKALIGGIILYAFWAIVCTLNYTSNWIETGVNSLIPYHPRTGPFEQPVRFIGALTLVWIIIRLFKVRQEVEGIKREQLNYFIYGSIIYAIGGTLLQRFGSVGLGIDPALGAYFSFPWMALTFYAITRYRLFDIQIILSSALSITILTILIGCINITIAKILSPYLGQTWITLITLPIDIVIFLKTGLVNLVQGKMNDVLLGNKYNYQTVLKESTKAITTILDQDELINYLVNAIQQSFKIKEACLFLNNKDGNYMVYYDWGLDKDKVKNYKITDTKMIDTMKNTKQLFIKEEEQARLPQEKFKELYGNLNEIEAEVLIPLFSKDSLIGFLTLGHKEGKTPYVQTDVDILETLTAQAAIAIQNSRLYHEAITDSLTGLYHHRYFMLRLKEEVDRSSRYGHAMSMLMIDIDLFKMINDTFGHPTGDKVLMAVTFFLKETMRSADIVARYGGEEFAILLPDTDLKGALIAAERIRHGIEELKFTVDSKTPVDLKITVSIGVMNFDSVTMQFTPDEIVAEADKALYRAKEGGRNRIESAGA